MEVGQVLRRINQHRFHLGKVLSFLGLIDDRTLGVEHDSDRRPGQCTFEQVLRYRDRNLHILAALSAKRAFGPCLLVF